jgi:hypothetical protein
MLGFRGAFSWVQDTTGNNATPGKHRSATFLKSRCHAKDLILPVRNFIILQNTKINE